MRRAAFHRAGVAVALAAVLGAGLLRGDDAPPEPPPEVLAQVTAVVKKAVAQKRQQFDAIMRNEIEATVKDTGLNADGAKALEAAAKAAKDAAADDFTARCLQRFREAYSKDTASTLQWLAKPNAADLIVNDNSVLGGMIAYVRPLDQPAWKDGLARTLSPEQVATREKARTERRKAFDKALADVLDQQVKKFRAQMELSVLAESSEIIAALELPKERADAMTALATRATDASLEVWRKGAEKSLAGKSDSQRTQALKNKNFYYPTNEKDAPEKQAVWTEGLAKLLTEEERTRLQTVRDSRKTRRAHALGQIVLTTVDEKLALTASQRQRLEPILEKAASSKPDFFPIESNGSYYSLPPANIYKAAAAAPREEVQPILDEAQWKHWQTITHNGYDGDANDGDEDESPRPSPSPAVQEISISEPEDMERIVSDHLQTLAAAHYKEVETVMLLRAEDAARVASLDAPHAARLQSAARGSAEAALAAWIPNTEQNTRAQVQNATPEDIRQKLGGGTRYYYERKDPSLDKVWKTAIDTELTPAQQTAWNGERDARSLYNAAAVTGFLLSEFDRRFSLSPTQWEKLTPTVVKALQDYQPDIQGMFSYGNNRPWFLMSYYMFMPLHAVPENDLKALLSRTQWDQWTASREYSYTHMYWENIQGNHASRTGQRQQQ